jgi:hypothetical protein
MEYLSMLSEYDRSLQMVNNNIDRGFVIDCVDCLRRGRIRD